MKKLLRLFDESQGAGMRTRQTTSQALIPFTVENAEIKHCLTRISMGCSVSRNRFATSRFGRNAYRAFLSRERAEWLTTVNGLLSRTQGG
jgi:hypothetical protein